MAYNAASNAISTSNACTVPHCAGGLRNDDQQADYAGRNYNYNHNPGAGAIANHDAGGGAGGCQRPAGRSPPFPGNAAQG